MNEDIAIPPVRADGLQLEEQRRLREWFWTAQRVSWMAFGIVCVIALLGFTGSGGWFHTQSIQFSAGTIELPRVSRWEASDNMMIRFDDLVGPREVTIGQPFFDRFTVERIQPEPAANSVMTNAQGMVFDATGDPPHIVDISIRSTHFGWTSFDLGMGDEMHRASLLVLP